MSQISLSIGLAIAAGSLTVLSPCVLPVLPLILGRSMQSHRLGPVSLVLGLISGFAIAGSLIGVSASWLPGIASLLRSTAIFTLLAIGIISMFPDLGYRFLQLIPLQSWLPHFKASIQKDSARKSLTQEFWIGTQLGLLWTPCAGPVLASILVLAAVQHQILGAFALLVAYGIGAGIPLLGLAYAGRYASRSLLHIRQHSQWIQRIGGMMIALTAIAILQGWDIQIQLWLAPFFPTIPL
jgi:cytochrome c-type biogenesis protein